MKATLLVFLALLCVPAQGALAQGPGMQVSINGGSDDSHARVGHRRDLRDARRAIVTRNGEVALLLARDVVAMQLTDRGLRDVVKEDREPEEKGLLAEIIGAAVRGSVRSLLDRSIEYPVSELRDVEYRGGRLLFTTESGERVFEEVRVNDTEVMESFSAEDARAFVREFRRVKRASR